jgi:hypothetical protein
VATFPAEPTSTWPEVKAASLEKAMAADAFTSALTITPGAMPKTPALVRVISPLGVTPVAIFEALPTKILAL